MEVEVGDRIRVRGDSSDFTEFLDGAVGTVKIVESDEVVAVFDGVPHEWLIWKYNIMEVIK